MKIALFPGKFQPVHLGHIITLMKIYDRFDKIIIGITNDIPQVLSQEERKSIFDSVFMHLPKYETVLIPGVIVGNKALDLPDFDICLTGNKEVINTMSDAGYKTEFLERSKGAGFSGTEQRMLIG